MSSSFTAISGFSQYTNMHHNLPPLQNRCKKLILYTVRIIFWTSPFL